MSVPEASGARETSLEDDREDIRVAYQAVCESLNVIDDFRARLLALLPLSSGAGIFLLLTTNRDGGNQNDQEYLGAIGVIGCLISVGLFVFELREIRVCRHLVRVGASLEERYMGFGKDDGQFLGRPPPSSATRGRTKRRQLLLPSVPMASGVVYLTVIAGWGYVASVGFR